MLINLTHQDEGDFLFSLCKLQNRTEKKPDQRSEEIEITSTIVPNRPL